MTVKAFEPEPYLPPLRDGNEFIGQNLRSFESYIICTITLFQDSYYLYTMDTPGSDEVALGRWSIIPMSLQQPQYGCHCHPMGSLEKLPLMHAILDRTANKFFGRFLTVLSQIVISLSTSLLPQWILEKLTVVLECLDCIGFLLVCCVEVLFPSLNRLIWGRVGERPSACCDRSNAALCSRLPSSIGKSLDHFEPSCACPEPCTGGDIN